VNMANLIKVQRPNPRDAQEAHIAAMWILFLRAPGNQTAPGEPVDLGEVPEKNFERWSPYSPAKPVR
jgi:hypothetical protein